MPTNIKELRQRLSDLKAEGREKLDAAAKIETKETVDEDAQKTLDALNVRMDEISADIEAVEKDIAAEDARLDREHQFAPLAAPLRPSVEVRSDEPDPAAMGGFAGMADFAIAVMNGTPGGANYSVDPRLLGGYGAAPTNFHQEGGAAEGYMVPPAMRQEIWELVFNDEDLVGMTDLEPTNSNTVQLIADETTPWGSTGITAKWRNEGVQMSADKLVTNFRSITLHELYAFALTTEELLEDAPRLNNRLTNKAAQAIRYKASDAIIYGTGAGQPLGYFTSGALVSVAKESGQAADTVVAANVAKMFSRLLGPSVARSVWLMNSDVMPQIMTMSIANQPIWTPPSQGFAQAPGGFLLGRPILLTEHAKTVGDKGDVHLVDLKGYYAANKSSGIKFDTSIHLFFDYNIQAFRWTFRLAGQPFLSAPVTPPNSSNTKSHFVVLDARA